MKTRFYMALAAFILIGFTATAQTTDTESENTETEKKTITLTPEGDPKIVLPETEFDFGTITQGDKVTHVFTFVNEGSAPLVIRQITTPCGCTAPSWPKEPIAPGASGEITVTFNSTGKSGNQVKQLQVIYNGDSSPTSITITGKVVMATE